MSIAPLDVARDLHARGLSVIPVPRPRSGVSPGQPGDGKVPAIPWRTYQARLPNDSEIAAWFSSAPMNLAVVTGEVSNVVVIDADSREALEWCTRRLPYTPWQTKTSKGYHLWYRHPGGRVANRARLETPAGRLAIDVRGDGGYVIAPGSVHATGAVYEFAGDWSRQRQELPRLEAEWLARPKPMAVPTPTAPRPSGNVVDRARRYLATVPRPEIGQGSDANTMYVACKIVRGFGLSEVDGTELLWEWAGSRPGWTYGWIAEKIRHAARYGTEPIGGLL